MFEIIFPYCIINDANSTIYICTLGVIWLKVNSVGWQTMSMAVQCIPVRDLGNGLSLQNPKHISGIISQPISILHHYPPAKVSSCAVRYSRLCLRIRGWDMKFHWKHIFQLKIHFRYRKMISQKTENEKTFRLKIKRWIHSQSWSQINRIDIRIFLAIFQF